MTDVGNHCFVWSWNRDGTLASLCPHCGYERASWESFSEDDDRRVQESKEAHRDRCPGTPWCVRRGRR